MFVLRVIFGTLSLTVLVIVLIAMIVDIITDDDNWSV